MGSAHAQQIQDGHNDIVNGPGSSVGVSYTDRTQFPVTAVMPHPGGPMGGGPGAVPAVMPQPGDPRIRWGIGGGGPNHPGFMPEPKPYPPNGSVLHTGGPGLMPERPGNTRIDGPVNTMPGILPPETKPMTPPRPQLQKGTMAGVKGHIQAGNMGKAKKAYEAGGGKWNKKVRARMRKKYGG